MNNRATSRVSFDMRHVLAVLAVLVVTFGSATAAPSVLRDGANHHLGDDSFIARFGREPTAGDSEELRMDVHLRYVREVLASRDATRASLADRRTQLLGYLDDYIAKGTTPRNTYIATRNPVFIDRDGTICAVGYLIERSAGREVAEHIAATHRLDYLEDIAAAMPEVAAWVDGSGFTLDELASIQPGYMGPEVMHMGGWLAKADDTEWYEQMGSPMPADGPYRVAANGVSTVGTFAHGQMTGAWTVTIDDKVRGRGTFDRGHGQWTSFRTDSTKLAEGPFARSRPSGTWTFFHPSGRVAARGPMVDGRRDGKWTFFYDDDSRQKLSSGRFKAGETLGTWRHYTQQGVLVATTRGRAWRGLSIDIEPGTTGVRHVVSTGAPADDARLDGLLRGSERIYFDEDGHVYDGTGHMLEQIETGTWSSRKCKWSKRSRTAAHAGDVNALHASLMTADADSCGARPVSLSKARGKRIEAMLATRASSHAPIPTFDIAPSPPPPVEAAEEGAESGETEVEMPGPRDNPQDLATYLTEHMGWYIEWPHVDRSFAIVYSTLPGYQTPATN